MKKIQLKDPISGENLYPIGIGEAYLQAIRLPRLDVSSDLITVVGNEIRPLTIAKNKVAVHYEFSGMGISFEDDGSIAYQGQSSLMDDKKGFTCAFENKHKFKDWLPFDEYHLKGYWNDWMHTRDTICNIIYEQMLQSRLFNVRPFSVYNDFSDIDVDVATTSNRLCHTDDFKCEMYINGNYWGLYSFRIKKDRENYKLKKSNESQVQLDPASSFMPVASFPWTVVEVRNPKISTDKAGNPYDGDNPTEIPDGTTHDIITAFYAKLIGVTATTTKTQLDTFLKLDDWIDHWLLADFCCNPDIFGKNTLYTTWDGVHWSLLPYDLNTSFGAVATDKVYEDRLYQPDFDLLSTNTVNAWFWRVQVGHILNILSSDINARYAELRKDVFTLANVMQLHKDITMTVGADVYKDDIERWHQPGAGYNTNNFIRSIDKIYSFMRDRITYLDNKYSYSI